MDEFSWFVGLYEGEGCLYRDGKRCTLQIDMTDEDTIARAAEFLGVKYYTKKVTGNRKPCWRVKVSGGPTRGKLYDLTHKMHPHLSKRRKTQLEKVWNTTPSSK